MQAHIDVTASISSFIFGERRNQVSKNPWDAQNPTSPASIFKARFLDTSMGRKNGRTEESSFEYRFGGCGVLYVLRLFQSLVTAYPMKNGVVVPCRIELGDDRRLQHLVETFSITQGIIVSCLLARHALRCVVVQIER